MLEEELQVEEEFYLWPENVETFNLWLSVQTQWYTDSGYRTGLNYAGVDVCLGYRIATKRKRGQCLLLLQEMERAALEEWASER